MTFTRTFAVLIVACLAAGYADVAEAAGGAFTVDTADVLGPGTCKVDSWVSTARNSDFSAVVNPACVFGAERPFELSVQTNRARADGEWSTTVTPKLKTSLIPTEIGRFGFAAEVGAGIDTATGENTSIFAYVPATLRLSETMRININTGWLWDRIADHHYFTYGVGFDWKLTDVFQWITEVYGQSGATDFSGVRRPRFQSGLRWRPVDAVSLDVLYGRNINGERSNWLTIGTTVRFPVQ